MRVFFIGCVSFSREMFKTLLQVDEIQIVGLATKSKSAFNSDHTDLSDLARINGIEFKYVKDINAEHISVWIKNLQPDLILCLGWSSLIKKSILEIPSLGVIGYHPAELPMNRGRHPIIWALVLGLTKTASTFFLIDEGPDSGDIISQEVINIDFNDTAEVLYNKLVEKARIQLIQIIDAFHSNNISVISQTGKKHNEWRRRTKLDGKIDWRMRSVDIYNLVRALDKPYPGAYFEFQGTEIKVWKCELHQYSVDINIEPGKVLEVKDRIITVKTGDGAVKLLVHELGQLEDIKYLL